MEWLLPRLLSLLGVMLAGGAAGLAIGAAWHAAGTGALAGGLVGAAGHALVDAWRAQRFMEWLRGERSGPAPRDTGMWGELAYRVERAVRQLQRQVGDERGRLEQFLAAIEASPNGVLLLDDRDGIEWCNSVAADHFGLDPQRDRAQRITNLVRAPAFVARLHARQADGGVTFPRPGGGTVAVTLRSYGDGRTLLLSQDITERERNEAMRRDFVANVSHEIRTPLTVLTGFLETLENLPLDEAERRRVHGLMAQQTARMQKLVADLLALAELEGSPRPGADRWVGLDGLLAVVLADGQALSAGRHAIELPAATGAEIAGSETELQSAIGNLVGNAVRYTPQGGRIELGWSVRADGSGELAVRDTGIGVAREHLARLTERFYRVDSSRSRATGGTGLGLSIVKHVMQRHGGELEIASEPGQGSRFTLVFPAARVRASRTRAAVQTVAG